jgi:hypothetical protein
VIADLRRRTAEIITGELKATGHQPGQGDEGRHTCPVRRCTRLIPVAELMCPEHWQLVPRAIQAAVWRYWDNGRGAGTPAHGAAADAAISAVNRQQEAFR